MEQTLFFPTVGTFFLTRCLLFKKTFKTFVNKVFNARKTMFSFSRRPEKTVFSKKALGYDFSCIIGKDDVSFFPKYDLTQ